MFGFGCRKCKKAKRRKQHHGREFHKAHRNAAKTMHVIGRLIKVK